MKSLKITLLLAVLVAVFVLTVSGTTGQENTINKNSIEKVDKLEHQFVGPLKKKNKIPPQNS